MLAGGGTSAELHAGGTADQVAEIAAQPNNDYEETVYEYENHPTHTPLNMIIHHDKPPVPDYPSVKPHSLGAKMLRPQYSYEAGWCDCDRWSPDAATTVAVAFVIFSQHSCVQVMLLA